MKRAVESVDGSEGTEDSPRLEDELLEDEVVEDQPPAPVSSNSRKSCRCSFMRKSLTSACGSTKIPAAWKQPPVKPTYLPAPHLASESSGKPCPEWCIGRQGDKEIIDMIRRLRRHPDGRGWKEIKVDSSSPTADHEDLKQDGLFGDAAVEADDLKRWGVDPAMMPGLRTGADTTYKPAL